MLTSFNVKVFFFKKIKNFIINNNKKKLYFEIFSFKKEKSDTKYGKQEVNCKYIMSCIVILFGGLVQFNRAVQNQYNMRKDELHKLKGSSEITGYTKLIQNSNF